MTNDEERLKSELAYVTMQRDALLDITWLDLPGDPDESTSKWREQFSKGWIRRSEIPVSSTSQTPVDASRERETSGGKPSEDSAQ
jgi:hypothetical protein